MGFPKDRFLIVPPDVVTSILKAHLPLDPDALPDSVNGIRDTYEQALADPALLDAAQVAALPVLKELTEKLYSSRSITIGLDAFGRYVASVVNGQQFGAGEREQWIVEEIGIPGQGGTGVGGQFNQPMWERRGHESEGMSRRTGPRGRGRVLASKDLALARSVHRSSMAQRVAAEGMRLHEESEERRRVMSLVGNPTELVPDGGPALVVDTNVILQIVSRENRTRRRDTGIGTLITSGAVQFGVTQRIVGEMVNVLEMLKGDPEPARRKTFDEESERDLLSLIHDHGVNVGWGGRVDVATAAEDETDSKFKRAAFGIVKRYEDLLTYLVTEDAQLLREQSALPNDIRARLTICLPSEFLQRFRKR